MAPALVGARGREHDGDQRGPGQHLGIREELLTPVGPRSAVFPRGAVGLRARHTGVVRITVWVRPGSACPGVGGERNGALIVQVSARAVDGKATEAALAAVAAAFGVRRRAVKLIAGAASRTKIVEVDGAGSETLARLLAGSPLPAGTFPKASRGNRVPPS